MDSPETRSSEKTLFYVPTAFFEILEKILG